MKADQALAKELIAFRRDLHRYPELSHQECETAKKVAGQLRKLGLEPRTGVGGHGVIAELRGDAPGPTIALRADMDALPIQEETGLPYASAVPGVMHACGHDAHTAILLGAAKLLAAGGAPKRGAIRFVFQPAEEIGTGAKAMIAEGVLDGVDEIYGLHNLPTLPAGMAALCSGPMMAALDRIEIRIEGVGGHGAIPDRSVDPIVCASAVVMGLQSIVSRELSPFDPAVVTIGSIHAGEANNVIPRFAEMTGTVRTMNPAVRDRMPERLERIVTRIAEGYRCKAELAYTRQSPVLTNDENCLQHARKAAQTVLGASHVVQAEPMMGSEDFAFFLEERPGCFFWIGSGPRDNAGEAYGLHHPKFTLNEDCIPAGAELLAAIAAQRLNDEGE